MPDQLVSLKLRTARTTAKYNDCKKFCEHGTALSDIPTGTGTSSVPHREQGQQTATAGVSAPGDDGLAF